MKNFFLIASLLFFNFSFAQNLKKYTIGKPIEISLPGNYVKSYDLNEVAIAQFKNPVKDKYVLVIQTEKDHLFSEQISFQNISEACEYYSTDCRFRLYYAGKHAWRFRLSSVHNRG